MTPFTYTGLPTRVIFGFGTLTRLAEEITALGCSRALLLCTPREAPKARQLAGTLAGRAVGVFAHATMHTPVDVTERALLAVRSHEADCVVALGGGSTIGLGKAIALRTSLSQIAIPTTYAGSEATPILGQTINGRKTTQRSLAVLPEVVLYDVDLTLSLPAAVSAASGMNALAHAVEALYAQHPDPVTTSMASDGIAALSRALPVIVAEPSNREARSNALYGAWLCGLCLANAGMALHHRLCHILGGTFNLPHAQTHAVVLPHAVAYNASFAPDAMTGVARILGAGTAAQGLFDLAAVLGAPTSLRELGLPLAQLDQAAQLTCTGSFWNPRPIEPDAVKSLLVEAYYGRRPV